MSVCVEKIGSVQIFLQDDGTYDAYDFATGMYIPDPYKDKPEYKPVKVKKSKDDVQRELSEIEGYPVLSLKDRKLKKESLEHFNVRIGVSEQDGETPKLHYYPYTKDGQIVGYKVRLIENKRIWSVGNQKDVDLFGWNQAIAAGAKRLYVTEGECDAIALYQIFREQTKGTPYEQFQPAIVSLPHGAASAPRDVARVVKTIREHFKEIALAFDNDEAGKKAVEAVLKIVPDAIVVNLPAKDANDCILEGRSKAAYGACVFNAAKPKNTRIVSGNELHDVAKEVAQFGLSFPWGHITEVTRGARFGETYYIGSAPKMGKSEVVNALAAHFMKEHNLKVFLCKPEESNKKTYKLVAGKIVGKFFHDPTKEFDEEAYERAGGIMHDKLFMLNLYQHVGWDSLKTDIRTAANDGCKVIIIDPITNLTNGMDAGSANIKLQEIAQELSAMALDLDVIVFIFCHLRNPDSGLVHERGGEVLSSQFAGSRAMARSCNYMFGLEGNRDPSLSPEERNLRTLVLLEDREFGESGRYKLYWDNSTGLFNEIKG